MHSLRNSNLAYIALKKSDNTSILGLKKIIFSTLSTQRIIFGRFVSIMRVIHLTNPHKSRDSF